MRTSRSLALAALVMALPSVASAQVYYSPAPVGSVPPHVYFRQRVRWHLRHLVPQAPQVVVVPQQPPPVWIAPVAPSPPAPPVYFAPPPPPVVITPQQPIYAQPQPVWVAPPACCMQAPPTVVQPVAPVIERAAPVPMFASRFGLGATGEGLVDVDGGSNKGMGILGQLRYRTSPHLSVELMAGYEKQTNKVGLSRTDVPVALALLIHLARPDSVVSPYLVGGVGLDFADLRLLDAPTMTIDDTRTQFLAQAGAGLELRLGQHFALNADVRAEGRWNLDAPTDAVKSTRSVDGKPVTPLADSVGLRIGVGGTIYF